MTLSVRDAVLQRRSIKLFNGQQVDKEAVFEILDEAKWAPNHGNRQPWRVVVGAGEQLPKVHELLRNLAIPKWEELSEDALAAQMKKFTLAGAYAFVLVTEDVRQKERLEDYAAASCYLQNVQLLAWEKGIGTCWKTPGFLDNPKFREALKAQPHERVISMFQFGYFDELPKARVRKELTDFVTEFEI
ncbi:MULTISPECIES: nitroreductase family protein [Solibacillus]|uniref:Nitroreductase n=1 Tax=Solibacillus merdavium TaxID=2762218 RepID=A0ABR8XQD9_9BACL|nr:nitroreductase [Solibacillus merdavium]MBD8034169.1 nitroreductase [Solibacillus merdavium]